MQVERAVLPGVAGADLIGAQEAHRHPGRDAQGTGHDGHGRGELFAVPHPPLRREELFQSVDPVGGLGVLDAVFEVVAEPVLQRHGLVVAIDGVPGDLEGEIAHQVRRAGRQLGVLLTHPDRRGPGLSQGIAPQLQVDPRHRVGETRGVEIIVAGDEVHRARIETPVAGRLHRGDRGLGR